VTRLCLILAIWFVASCATPPPPTPAPHYVLGVPYQAGGVWWYPRVDLRLDERGLAEVYGGGHAPLTTDGEAFDQAAMAAANQTLPLPAIAVVTNLETGRQVKLRINDQGPPTPRRMLAVTRRVALLLGFPPDGVARVRLEVLEGESQMAQNALSGAPKLDIASAPRGAVEATSLAPPPGARGSAGAGNAGGPGAGTAGQGAASQAAPGQGTTRQASQGQGPSDAATTGTSVAADAGPPMRLAEIVTQVAPDPGALWIDLGSFPTYEFANMQRAAVAQLGAIIESEVHGRGESFKVTIGPIPDVAQADRLLDETVAAGITDVRIVVR